MAKAKVTITFERNDSHPKGEGSLTMGPFEWIQFTYDSVRAGENGEIELAGRTTQGYWETDGKQIGTSETWSDMIIGACIEEVPEPIEQGQAQADCRADL